MIEKESEKLYSALWRALLFIQNNLDKKISLHDLAKISGYSQFHFHRSFKKFTGESVNSYIKRLQLENAAFRLRIKDDQIIDVALDSGYYTHETFTRAFRKQFGVNPIDYKKKIAVNFSDKYIKNISRVLLKERRCIFKRYNGPYENSGVPVDKNSIWRKLMTYLPEKYRDFENLEFLGISYDDPVITKEDSIRYDACIAVPHELHLKPLSLILPRGFYIEANHNGPFNELISSYHYLIDHWSKEYKVSIDYNTAPFEKFIITKKNSEYIIDSINIYIPLKE